MPRASRSPLGSYVCAFRGRPDFYHAPLALEEGQALDQMITDAYSTPWIKALAKLAPPGLRTKMRSRSQPAIPDARVRCLWGTFFVEQARHRLGFAPEMTFQKLDPQFSRAAARRAARSRADLFLYNPYAWEAFTARYPHTPRKVLFQYHPHTGLQSRLLAEDNARWSGSGEPLAAERTVELPEHLARRDRDAWMHADLILCASSFTRRSLLEAGADERICRVVPYGVETPVPAQQTASGEHFEAVFVGTGGQRKGLHHLLRAWKAATLPPSSRLTLVCRVMDSGLENLAATTPNVAVLRGLPHPQLHELYASSTLFVMPSLVEGFGHVYLEALAQGCPVLGTANTCLPDLGNERDGVFQVAPGNVDELAACLEKLSRTLPGDDGMRAAARACAARLTWAAFRAGVRRELAA